MKLSSAQKIVIGILTLLPFILLPYILYEIFSFVIETVKASESGDPKPADILLGVLAFITPVIMLSILTLALLIFYIVHTIGNKSIDSTERIIWILIFIFFGVIAFPIYWFMRLWNEGQ